MKKPFAAPFPASIPDHVLVTVPWIILFTLFGALLSEAHVLDNRFVIALTCLTFAMAIVGGRFFSARMVGYESAGIRFSGAINKFEALVFMLLVSSAMFTAMSALASIYSLQSSEIYSWTLPTVLVGLALLCYGLFYLEVAQGYRSMYGKLIKKLNVQIPVLVQQYGNAPLDSTVEGTDRLILYYYLRKMDSLRWALLKPVDNRPDEFVAVASEGLPITVGDSVTHTHGELDLLNVKKPSGGRGVMHLDASTNKLIPAPLKFLDPGTFERWLLEAALI